MNPVIFERAVSMLKMPMVISDPSPRIAHFCVNNFQQLENAGFSTLGDQNTKMTIHSLQSRVYPVKLKTEMKISVFLFKKCSKIHQ